MNKIWLLLFLSIFMLGCQSQANIELENSSGSVKQVVNIIPEIVEETIVPEPIKHVATPENVKSVYFTANALGNKTRRDNLDYLVINKEINSVTIDVKTVSGYTSFEFPADDFGALKPESNDIIKDIKAEIEALHEDDVYVIARIVVFKDNYMTQQRPDLAIRWSTKDAIWNDYKGNHYLDPGSDLVKDYYVDMALSAYRLGFDEINFDYIRFPTDGYISQTEYPHASSTIVTEGKWGKMKVIDEFSRYVTKKLREAEPEIKISADVFGLVTNVDLFQIGQNLESFLLHFDYVGPMIYPSHYGRGYLGYQVPDNAPHAIFEDSMKKSKSRIDAMNANISALAASGSVYQIKDVFTPDYDIQDFEPIQYSKMRPWLQGFSCGWCKGATSYNRWKFREQIRAINEAGLDSWWVWSSGSNYYPEWYNKD
ncbi:putative glycoside hydrolase [Candidatus Gracilibacteria bacterium]|nr:putative glycoside hydrolase [Candidatus Gracilibacteria bacterium]